MDEPKLLDRATIEKAFRFMGRYLLDRKTLGEIAIYGGSAILLQFDWRKASRDVDARVTSDSSHSRLGELAEDIRAKRR
jgi:putative NIF3 family GTP cyclohydrolase 1 type 2